MINRPIKTDVSRGEDHARQGKKSQPREKMMEAALEVLNEHRISGTRMRQIAKQAGMSQGNLHDYFPSKDVLFLNLLDHLLEIFVEECKDPLADVNIRLILKISLKNPISLCQMA